MLPRASAPLRLPFSGLVTALVLLMGSCASDPTRRDAPVPTAPDPAAARQAPAAAAHQALTIDAIYDPPGKRVEFGPDPTAKLVWLDDARYLLPKSTPGSKKQEWLEVEAESGKTAPFAPVAKLEAALAALPGISPEKAAKIAYAEPGDWTGAKKAFLIAAKREIEAKSEIEAKREKDKKEDAGDLYLYTIAEGKLAQVTQTPDVAEEEAQLSPDGKWVAFVAKNDLHVVEIATGADRKLTSDGGEKVLNGKLDWVYQEEVYGRGKFRAFWWSPDSSRLAFLRIDEEGVPIYTLVDDVESPAAVETCPYPRAGDPNPKAKLGIAKLSGETEWVDLAPYASGDFLIVDVDWSPSGDLAFQVQDREQSWLDLLLVPAVAAQGSPAGTKPEARKVLRETTSAWVSPNGSPRWLEDGTFLWTSERTGWQHVYRYDTTGKLLGAVTSGKWEERDLHGVDEKSGWVYFSGTERSPIGADEYRVKLDGTGLARLTQSPGSHGAKFNPSFTRFVDRWSDASTPVQARLCKADGSEVRVIDKNDVPALAKYGFVKPEFLKVRTRDGFEMEAMLVKPPDFDPKKRYPVFQITYAGPHAPTVHDAFGGQRGMFLQLVAQQGIVVWECDNRSASGKGVESTWACFRKFGETELADIEDGIAWLKQQPWVDAEKIGIYGWSFGGFMTSYALTHSKSFAMGIAGGSVTDWRNYDSIYTERYMKTPEHNEVGYERTSVVAAAKNLHGELLLIHGELDDNVHPQNTMQLAHALQKAGKPFRMMIYPKSQHGVSDPALVKHLQATMLAFIEETLLGKRPS